MKTLKMIAYGILASAMVTSASAATTIRILGSNGDRTATQNAIKNIFTGNWTFTGNSGSSTQADATNAIASNYGAWNGTWSGNAVIIKVSFAGAVAGVAAVSGDLNGRFVATDGSNGSAPAVKDPYASDAVLNTDYELAKPDFGFSTNFQGTTPFLGDYLSTTYAPLEEENVGVSPLVFYASPGYPGSPSANTATSTNPAFGSSYASGTYVPNITTQAAQFLYSTGVARLSQFTADPAHEHITVFALGRNNDAGQRFGVVTEIGLGTTAAVKVYFPTVSGSTVFSSSLTFGGAVDSQVLWPVSEQNSGFLPTTTTGDGGYSTGAKLAQSLTTHLSLAAARTGGNSDATYGFYIGYVTPSDGNARIVHANVASGDRGVALSYNGVPYTAANVKNGTYTAWVYNRIIRRPGSPASANSGTSIVRNFANALRDRILTVDGAQGGGILVGDLRIERYTDGGLINPLYP
ncbi:MAG: hypothetical protein JWR15_4291 [Prosthecobacter sp.]|nr:hypothetical protein [Prosthecobacter sp.]